MIILLWGYLRILGAEETGHFLKNLLSVFNELGDFAGPLESRDRI